uniref:Uncharacterized protein n=1 Tax=Avena sativa TaxID=4498 RepID=A0ACD5U859_AVESA
MENLFSLDVEIPNTGPFHTPTLSLHPQEDSKGVGGERIDVGGGVCSGGPVNRCLSEWCFQKFIDDSPQLDTPAASAANLDAKSGPYNNLTAEASRKRRYNIHLEKDTSMVEEISTPPTPTTATAMLDPVAYNTILRRKLDADLAAVAMWRAQTSHGIRRQGSHGNRSSRNSNASNNVGSQNHIGDVGVHKLSSSSWDPSPSDDDMEGDAETTRNMNVTAAKVKKRKESNRDSARRSRSRKAAHMKELEEQVSLLRVENNLLMRRLAEVSQRYTNVAVDNRVLKANVETLEIKVNVSEETMKRLTTASNFPQAIPISGSRLNTISNTLFPTQDTPVSYFSTTKTDVGVNNSYIPELAPIPAFQIFNPSTSLCIQPMVTLDHHQRRMRGGMPSTSVPTTQWEATVMDQNEFVNMGMQ